jgi:hypothetical protein
MVGGAGTPSINVTFGALSGSNTRLIVAVTNDPTANSVPVARVVINVLKNGLDFQMNQVFAYSATGYSLPVFNVNTMTASDVFSVTADFARSLSASEITYHLYPVAETATWSTILYSIIDLGPTASEDDILPPVGLFIGSAPKPTISALFEAEDAGILKFIIQMDNTTTEADLINVYIANEIQFQTVSESVTSILNGLTIVDNNPADIYLSNNGTSFLANTTYAVSARYLFSDSLSVGPWSDSVQITTAADPPLPGATTVVLECTNGNAIVAWDAAQPSDVGTGYALQYYVELKNSVGTTLTSLTTSISSLNSDGNVQAEYTYSFTELTSDTSYTAVVTAAYVKTGSTTIYCQPAYSAEVYLHKIPAVTAIALDLTQTTTVRLTITVNPYATPTNVNSVIAFMPYLGGFQLNATAINSSKTAWQTSAVTRNPAVDYDAVNAYVIAGGPGGFSYAVYPMSAA